MIARLSSTMAPMHNTQRQLPLSLPLPLAGMARWQELPYELLSYIFSYLSLKDLCAASLLGKYLHSIVEPILYRTLRLQNYRISLVLRTFVRNRRLALLVRHAEFTWSGYMDGILFDPGRQTVPSAALDDFAKRCFVGWEDPILGVQALWTEYASAAAQVAQFADLEAALLNGTESGQVALALMYMDNLETLTVKPAPKSVLYTHLAFDLFSTGKFLTKLRSYTRIGTRELKQPPMSFIGYPAMFAQSIREIQLGPGPIWALDEDYEDVPSLVNWQEKFRGSSVERMSIQGGSLEEEDLNLILQFPRSLRSFTYDSSVMARYQEGQELPFTLHALRSALMPQRHSLTTLILTFPCQMAFQESAIKFGKITSLVQFTALETLAAPIDVLLGVLPGGGIFHDKILPQSLVSLSIFKPAFLIHNSRSAWGDDQCLEAILYGINNAKTHCPSLKSIFCGCFVDAAIAETFVISTIALGIQIRCEEYCL